MATDVLIIDDESALGDVFAIYFKNLGDAVFTAPEGRSGIQSCGSSKAEHS